MILRILIPVLVLGLLTTFMLWPLSSEDYAIEWDQKMLEGKSSYVNSPQQGAPNKPNILFIMADDLSIADISLCASDAPVKTPNMEAIAQRGVQFERAYVSHAVCSPSRAAIATGRYPQRFGFEHQMHDRYLKNRMEYYGFKYFVKSDPWIPQLPEGVPRQEDIEKQGLPPSEITMAEILKVGGYATGLMGKWHLGTEEFNQPCALGFDEFYGFNASHSLYSPEGTSGIVDQKIAADWTDDYIWSGQRNGPHAVTRDCQEVTELEYLTFRIAEESIAFMERHRSEPFFLWASFNAPHTPLQAPQKYVTQFDHVEDPVKRVHYAMIQALDDAIGDIDEYLQTSGIDSNTIVIFISDNGGAEYNLTTENGEYKGGKITDFEGGIRVPMFMTYPDKIKGGLTYESPVMSMDIVATMATAAGIALPTDRVYDGKDLVAHVNSNTPAHDYLFWRKGYNAAVRSDDWKMAWDANREDTLLFNIKKDPTESRNVYQEQPSVAKSLIAPYLAWSSEMQEPLWPALIDYYCEIDGKKYWFDN